jgi:hypothetical protein
MWDYTCPRAGFRVTARQACLTEFVTDRSVCLTYVSCFIVSSRPVACYRYFTDCCRGFRFCPHVYCITNGNETLITNQSALFPFVTPYRFPPLLTDKDNIRLRDGSKVAKLNSHYYILAEIILFYYLVQNYVSRIWGSHGGEYEEGCLLGCSTVKSGRSLPTFQRSLLPPSSGQWVRRITISHRCKSYKLQPYPRQILIIIPYYISPPYFTLNSVSIKQIK